MAYTQAELNTAIEKIVRTSLRRDYGALGNRRVDRTFSDLQDAAAGVFILFGNAPFYIVLLAARRLQKAIETEQQLITDFIETVEDTNRNVKVITSLSPLSNARTALSNLATATGQRTTDFTRIEDVGAFKRFESNTQRFLDESSANVVQGGEIKQTPGEARGNLAGLFRELRTQHADVVRRAALLQTAIDDFNALNLAKTLSENIIANSRTVIDEALTELQGLSEKDRLTIIRRVTLDILAARSSVRNFGSISGPQTFLTVEGSGSVFADATHPATSAFLESDILDPYPVLQDTRDVDIILDGDTVPTTTIQVLGSFVATAESVFAEPFDIDSTDVPPTHEFQMVLENYPSVGVDTNIPVGLTNNATKPIYELVSEVNADIDAVSTSLPLIAEPYANPQKFEGLVDITAPGTAEDADLIPVNTSIDWTDFDIRADDLIILRDVTSANDETILIVRTVSGTPPTSKLEVDVVDGAITTEGSKNIVIGSDGLALRLRITEADDPAPKPDYRLQALTDRVAISFTYTTSVAQSEDEQFAALTHIGFVPGMSFRSKQTPAQALATAYNQSAQAAVLGAVRTEAEALFQPTYYSGRGRTEPSDFLRVIASIFQGNGDVTSVGLVSTFTVNGAATAGAAVGNIVVVRTHSLAAEINLFGTITSVDDSSIVATMVVAITPETGIDIEVGPNLSAVGFDPTVVISGGSINDGQYTVTGIGLVPIEIDLGVQLPVAAGAGFLPLTFTIGVGRFAVRFKSLDTTLATAISIDAVSVNSAAGLFFSSLPSSDVGETKYFQLPEFPKNLEQEDTLERNITAVGTPDTTHEIVSLESANLLVELDPELPTDTASVVMTPDSPIAFARIRKKRFDTFLTLSSELASWGDLSENQAQFFTNFSRLLNPLSIDSNPTIVEVNDARLELQGLSASLDALEGYLTAYQADEVTQVDSLLQGFQQKGADRASDIILEARFTDFFGLDQDELSYAGTVQKQIRGINRQDLPVRKDRLERGNRDDGILAAYDEVDFEFNQDDIDTTPDLDIPIGADIDWPERAY